MQAFVLDNQLLFAASFAELLQSTQKFESVKYSDNIELIRNDLLPNKINFLFMDYLLTNVNSLSEIRNFRNKFPSIKIIIMGSVSNPNLFQLLQKAGANGFISKNSEKFEVESLISSENNNSFFISSNLKEEFIEKFISTNFKLTTREYEILQYIKLGKTIIETANHLNLSKHTIIAHRRNIMEKLHVNSVTNLINRAKELGLV